MLERALAEQARREGRPLGAILVANRQVAPEKIEAIIKAQIERIVYSFFSWQEGTFDFQLDETGIFELGRSQSLQILPWLADSIPNGWLPRPGVWLLKVVWICPAPKRTLSEELVDDCAASVGTLSYCAADRSGPLFIVDDDGPTRSVLKKAFMRAGFEVEAFALGSDLIRACSDRIRKSGNDRRCSSI